MTEDKIYVGDTGTAIIADTEADLATATETNLIVEKPDRSIVTWVGVREGETSVKYLTVEDDLNIKGIYKAQAVVTLPGWSGSGETFEFEVFDRFK